jgi:hypothetical protein
VAGEQLWRRRERIPATVPAPLAPTDRLPSARIDWSDLVIAVRIFGLLVGVSAVLGGASAALIGIPAGFVLRDVLMLIGVARWQRRHGCRLAWIDDGDGVTPRVIAPGKTGRRRLQGEMPNACPICASSVSH